MRLAAALVLALLLVPLGASLAPAADVHVPDAAPTSYVVGFGRDVSEADLARLLSAGATLATPLHVIDAAVVRASPATLATLEAMPGVRYVEAGGRAVFLTYQNDGQTGVADVRQGLPPLPRGFTGAGVTIAVVDTGISEIHPDLQGRVVDHLSFDLLAELGGALTQEQRDALSEAAGATHMQPANAIGGHGSLVAGVTVGTGVAATGGIDMRGVATGASLVDYATCCVSYDVAGDATIFLLAYDHMVRHQADYPGGIRVSVNSWGISPSEPYAATAFREMLLAAVDAGIVPVFAAGNSGPGDDTVLAPQNAIAELVTVGISCPAIDGLDLIAGRPCGEGELSGLSSHGPMLDVVAPMAGAWVPTMWIPGQSTIGGAVFGGVLPGIPPPHDDPLASAQNRMLYTQGSGTSLAAPYVAGVVALMLEARPDLTPGEVQAILQGTAQDFGAPGHDKAWGHGEVEAFAAVQAALAAG